MEISRNKAERTLTLSQKGYITRMLSKFLTEGEKGVENPSVQGSPLRANDGQASAAEIAHYSSSVGLALYATVLTRPDLAYKVRQLARFMSNPSILHKNAIHRV
jgi:hypothetical protein